MPTIITRDLDAASTSEILAISETHFVDLKGSDIQPARLLKTVSAFANTSGGEIYVGIDEETTLDAKVRTWRGFADEEAANPIFQVLNEINPLSNNFSAEFLRAPGVAGLVLHLTIFKTQDIVFTGSGRAYVRRNAQNLPLAGDDALERLKYDKGVKSFEDELLGIDPVEIANSAIVIDFMLDTVPTAEPGEWLEKQRVMIDGRPTVAGTLLFSDNPQAILPKRSAIKVLRYQTKQEAERDYLAATPETIEGPLYSLIYDAVDRVKAVIESIEKIGPAGMEKITYPEEALHEILTNAVLHRDYNVAADVQVRIFDNRVEIESPVGCLVM